MLSEWQNHKAQLHSYINKKINDSSASDDILQDVFIKASTNIHQLKAKGNLKSWLYRIAHNAVMDYYRQKPAFEELPEHIAEEELTYTEKAQWEMAEIISPLIQELPDKYRIPLQMAELENKSQQEVADLLGLSLPGAKSRIQRGRTKLREMLMECCDIEISNSEITECKPKDSRCKPVRFDF